MQVNIAYIGFFIIISFFITKKKWLCIQWQTLLNTVSLTLFFTFWNVARRFEQCNTIVVTNTVGWTMYGHSSNVTVAVRDVYSVYKQNISPFIKREKLTKLIGYKTSPRIQAVYELWRLWRVHYSWRVH